jgi:hypothetical protein
MGTAVGVSQQIEEFRSDNIDVELHVIEWPIELVVETIAYEQDRYREHFASAYRRDRAEFHELEPAYRFGHELRSSAGGRAWSSVEPTARSYWERSSPRTWERFAPAIRHAWERGGG